jgi:hypothetical protein|uniref:Uncharacterized protein n=1 Tax=viral metagenome TaxID=1070528 RepID=A0A6C0D2V4_9ZZZZ
MFELVIDLVEGETYHVVQTGGFVEGDMIYLGGSFFRYFDSTCSFQVHQRYYNFYRYVTKHEYYTKVKEKYDQTSLNIVLKRLVDESFQW